MRNVWNSAINIGTFTLKNTETNQVLALDSVVLDSGERVIVAFGNGSLAAEAQFILANNYPDQNLSEDGLYWQWQTDLILGDDAARLQLFENNIKRDELRYGDDIGKLAENDSSQDSVYVLRRQGYEQGQNASDYPEYSRQSQRWEETGEVAIIYGGYVLRPVNLKRYELKDHLGNVRVIVSDVKDATLGAQGGATAFAAIIEHYSHYYPFGMEKPSMVWDKGAYRYGYQGQEMDNEIQGIGNAISYEYRITDPRTGRFYSVDPLSKDYPYNSCYAFSENRVIDGIDLEGLEFYYAADGTLLGKVGNSTEVMVVQARNVPKVFDAISKINKGYSFDAPPLALYSQALGMTNEELNTRAFMSTLKQTENHCGEALPYNAKHGVNQDGIITFTDKTYEEAPEDYANHPYADSKGASAAGAYQLLRSTFKTQRGTNPNVTDFGPNSQDYAVIGVFGTEGVDALEYIKSGDLAPAVQRLTKDKWGNTQFASLPGGGQEKKGFTMEGFQKMFKQNFVRELNNDSNISLPKGEMFKN
ncbi:MAG: RHS repeat-associated core domain-containing protein [Bacteroidia bacterium]